MILGEPAHDVATVTGAVPAGASLVFEAYRQDGDTATCTPDELVFTSAATAVGGPGEYRSEEVIFETVGTYYWIETLTGSDGTVLHRGLCGAPDETTTVVPVTPELPDTPSGPPSLALTGAGDWLPFGIGGGILALAGGLTLMFGRRLAMLRERTGYVREEDAGLAELFDDTE